MIGLQSLRRAAPTGIRSMATLSELKLRIDSTKNIRKITSSMKMVSAAKMRGDEMRLKAGKQFGKSLVSVFDPTVVSEQEDAEEVEELVYEKEKKKYLILAISSDRGLCGGVNSAVTRNIRGFVESLKDTEHTFEVACVGDKGRAQLTRMLPKHVTSNYDEAWKNPINFATTCAIAEHIAATEHDELVIVYNVFKSAIAYDTVRVSIPKFASHDDFASDAELEDGQEPFAVPLKHMEAFEFEPDDLENQVNLYEYTVATTLFGCFLDNLASEQSARMSAMDNASNNAGDMIESLTLKYNRLRQAKITTELTEIVSGAAALETAD